MVLYLYVYFIYIFYLFVIGFYIPPSCAKARSGWQVLKSGSEVPSWLLSCALDHPFVMECKVCSLSTKPQLHYTITVYCNRTAHSQHRLPASIEAQELNLKYAPDDR